MIRDIGQRGHEKSWKSGIVRGRGKAEGGCEGGSIFLFFLCPPPPLPPAWPFPAS